MKEGSIDRFIKNIHLKNAPLRASQDQLSYRSGKADGFPSQIPSLNVQNI